MRWITTPLVSTLLLTAATTLPAATLQNTESLTQALIRASALPIAMSAQSMPELIGKAKLRRDLLIQHLIQNPAAASHYFTDAHFPRALLPYTEHMLYQVQGDYAVMAVIGGPTPMQYELKTTKERFLLHFTKVPNARTGAKLLIHAAKAIADANGDTHLLIQANDVEVLEDGIVPNAIGPQKTLVMIVNFSDQKNSITLKDAQNMVFTTIGKIFYDSSFHQTSLTGKSVGLINTSVPSTLDCNTLKDNIATAAIAAAKQAGIVTTAYPHHLFIFPRSVNCTWAGLSTVGGAPSRSWSNGYNEIYVITHELGHALGLYHSNLWFCPGATISGQCTRQEYGDNADVMGYSATGAYFNAFQKERLGWLNYQVSPPIQTVSKTGTYTIYPYETQDNNNKAIKILKQKFADGSSDYYYIEYRQPIGADASLATCRNCNFTQGVLFHFGNSVKGNTSYLLDMVPSSKADNIVALLPGKSFTDPNTAAGAVTFKLESLSGGVAKVSVTFPTKS